MLKEEKIVNYSIENIKAGELKDKDFDFFQFEYFAKDIEHLKKSHRHEFHAFIFINSGSGSQVIDFVEYDLIPYRFFYIRYSQIHAWKTLKQVKGYIVLFTDDFYNAIYTGNKLITSDRLLSELTTFTDVPKNRFQELNLFFQRMEYEFSNKYPEWNLISCLLLKMIVLEVKRLSKNNSSTNEKFKRSHEIVNLYREYINESFIELKKPKDYAEKLNITANYLNGICKEITGKPAGQLIKERILLEAKRLILHTQLTIEEISNQLGFDDKSHFGKYFKKQEGISPDNFRKSISKKIFL
ncbi:MAG TPA: helix-turn-helix domain-containing protein [Cytophagaceae bacterium]|jgi:AraC family transcriptional activator of pobA|nr:helix-turn-helix domain-containing protein [Cytophagaceae bacterium]